MASGSNTTASPEQEPRRNLTKAFEALCIVSPDETIKEEKTDIFESSIVSPTGVTDLSHATDGVLKFGSSDVPEVTLHPDLRLNLSSYCIGRVSCYSIVHDINKEAVSMSTHDPLLQQCQDTESISPMVLTARGIVPQTYHVEATPELAVIDEEKWLLAAIADRSSDETSGSISSQCPATFLQAMGEKEYDVNSHTNATTRTQLWKPSRSWWEAKSGKNPWIEPASHNKRWRYLWPLIHYHKFLHKCIKKLKRNAVDVKLSVSPVSVFLREEVCAVSDHLAAVSLFGSDEWMDCLQHFIGWTVLDTAAVSVYQNFVVGLPLRSLAEPGDVDSPVLRNQIDEAFLRTMAVQRDQLRDSTVLLNPSVTSSKTTSHPATASTAAVSGPPPVYPRPLPVPRQIHGVRRPRYYPNGWYGWENMPQDTSSVHSELSANSYAQPPYDPQAVQHAHYHQPPMYLPHAAYYHPVPPPGATGTSDHSNSTGGGYTYPDQYGGWMDPAMAYSMHHHPQHYYAPSYPPVPANTTPVPVAAESSPFKYDPENSNSMSPYWSHLDQATLAMGLATPAKVSPSTPRRRHCEREEEDDDVYPGFCTVQGPLLRQQQYYGPDAVPPSPATQFMMSPQASFAYNYGYGFSPTRLRRNSARKLANLPTPLKLVERPNSPTNTIETSTTESLEQSATTTAAV